MLLEDVLLPEIHTNSSGRSHKRRTRKYRVPRTDYKGTYSRRVHFIERVSAHLRNTPDIVAAHLETLHTYHHKLLENNCMYKIMFEQQRAGKKEVQILLRHIDKALQPKNSETSVPHVPEFSKCACEGVVEETMDGYFTCRNCGKKYFESLCRLYLEKWNEIVSLLGDINYPVYKDYELAMIGCKFMMFSNLWVSLL